MKRRIRTLKPGLAGLIAALLSWGTFFVVLWPKILYRTAEGIWAGWIGVWGDWAAHLSYASVFAYRDPQDWLISHPLYKGVKFTYPLLADALSGLLMRVGVDIIPAFIVPSILFSLLLVVVIYTFFYTILKSSKQAFLAMTLNFLSGGLGFVFFFRDLQADPRLENILFPPREYTHMTEVGIKWISLISSQLIPQRAFLVGLPVVLVLILTLHNVFSSKKAVDSTTYMSLGFVSSLLLFVHVHSFIAFVFFCAAYALVYYKKWQGWFVFAVSAGMSSALIFSALYGGEIHPGFFRFYPWWLANAANLNMNWLNFWWLNWGLFLPLALFATWRTKFYRHPLFIGAALIFAACNLVLFQPYDWDNSKLLSFTYMVLCIPVVKYCAQMWRKKDLFVRGLVLLCIALMTLSGTLDLVHILNTSRVTNILLTTEDIVAAEQFRARSRPTDTVLASDQHNHWVSTLTGRQMLLGYRGWIWTYGIDYTEREQDVETMFAGGEQAEQLFDKYGVSFVVIGPSEKEKYNPNELYFMDNYPRILNSELYNVYSLGR